jgi:hypothetical protein
MRRVIERLRGDGLSRDEIAAVFKAALRPESNEG